MDCDPGCHLVRNKHKYIEFHLENDKYDQNGIRIIGLANLPGKVPINASQMFSSNLYNLVEEFWNAEEKRFELNFEDEIIKGCVITHGGEIVNEMIANHYAGT